MSTESADGKILMNQREYAEYRGVTVQAVGKAVASGRISCVRNPDGSMTLDRDQADLEWEKNTFVGNQRGKDGDSKIESDPKETSAGSYAKSRAVRETALARLAHLELQRKMGNLVDARTVELEAFADGRKIRNAMISLPDRLAPILAAETEVSVIHSILLKEIHETLRGLARELRETTGS